MVDPDWKKCGVYTMYSFGLHTYVQFTIFASTPTNDGLAIASQARLFRAVAELTARESHEEEELLPELLQREKSLVAFENVIVTWDLRSGFIACIRLIRFPKELVTVIARIHEAER